MFSGKTTRLVEIYNKHSRSSKNVVAINYSKDTRYHDTMLSTHDKVLIPCIFADNIQSLLSREDLLNANVILINEGQFFEDIYDSVLTLVEKMHKKVFVCGLDGDFKRNKFGNLLDLIPYSDCIVKLHSNCTKCNNYAIFSHRISCEQNQVVIGSDNYMPLCRYCYQLQNAIA
tara:strand:- start:2739 stop:3257 length:519 start_codon:yes stop_codon:yes gene_type:complete